MFAKMHPFLTKPATEEAVRTKNSQCCFKFGKHFGSVSLECRAFISSLLERDPTLRFTEEQASGHSWLTKESSERREPVARQSSVGTAVGALENEKMWSSVVSMPFEGSHSPSTTQSRSTSQTTFSRVKTVGRNLASKFSRAIRALGKKTSTVAPV
eukprot:TRINITY_DN43068_c0_g1_i1.p1 TRINITY_DN43068_c0_g1~~TRINITY_DN43068_c0_g1_i1.p1  ORF type:complete len:156 (+),score=17.25 TRINITY_DN43068_c0_g1_i1:158-625(+)